MSTRVTIVGVADIDADACLSRTTELSAEVTQWPIETRSVISDHVIVQPVTIALDLVFTRRPAPGIQSPEAGDGRPEGAFRLLSAALLLRNEVSVTTPSGTTTSLILTSVSSPQDVTDGTGRRVSLRATRVRRVSSQESSGAPASRRSAAMRPRSAPQDIGSLLVRVAVAAEVGRAVVTMTPNVAALQVSASYAARAYGSLATRTDAEVARILGVPASLLGGR